MVLAAATGILVVFPASPCWACRCVEQSPAQHAANADVVFAGRVLSAEDPSKDPGLRVQATLDVETVYKGQAGDRAVVETPPGGPAACGVEFAKGERYTVFAYRNERGRLETNTCSATVPGPIDPAAFGLAGSQAGSEPGPSQPTTADRGASGWILVAAAGALGIVGTVLAARRLRGRGT